jgi:hypothetical protein
MIETRVVSCRCERVTGSQFIVMSWRAGCEFYAESQSLMCIQMRLTLISPEHPFYRLRREFSANESIHPCSRSNRQAPICGGEFTNDSALLARHSVSLQLDPQNHAEVIQLREQTLQLCADERSGRDRVAAQKKHRRFRQSTARQTCRRVTF